MAEATGIGIAGRDCGAYGAQFLPGAFFDVRVEVHADALSDDFAVTLNGEDVLDSAELTAWTADDSLIGVAAQAATWRSLSLDEPSACVLQVTAGSETHSANWTVREVGEGSARNVAGIRTTGG